MPICLNRSEAAVIYVALRVPADLAFKANVMERLEARLRDAFLAMAGEG